MRKLCFIFFLSGASALIFETVWFQLAGLTFGSSVWASALVLSAFMGGLALGNALAAFRAHRFRSAIRLYAGLELAIAIPGFLVVLILPGLSGYLAPVLRAFLEHPLLLNALRSVLAGALLLIPATAMGATLPVIVRVLSRQQSNFGRVLGILYGWNTLGAVSGVLIGERVLIHWIGLRGAGGVAAVLNITAALLALWLARSAAFSSLEPAVPPARLSVSARTTRILLAAFLSGFVLLALEVVWFRFVVLFFNGHSWNFALMLATVLLGISLGGLIAARWFHWQPGAQQFLIPVLAVNGILVVVLYRGLIELLPLIQERVVYDSQIVWVSLFLILPITLGSGVTFTMLGAALHRDVTDETAATGLLTLANTTGAGVGSLVAGVVLIPILGIERSFFVLAALYGAILLVAWGVDTAGSRWIPRLVTALLLVVLILFPFGLMLDGYLTIKTSKFPGEQRIAVREGLTETAQYLRKDLLGQPYYYHLLTNNYSMSDTKPYSQRYTKLFAYWPMVVHPKPESALLICFGCGSTAQALTETESYREIDIVDISRDIVELSELVYSKEENPIHDPRVKVHIEDGRFFLLTTDRKFDLITGEPPPPAARGVVNLYTQEYFELMHDSLRDGGIVTYWLPIHLVTEAESRSILRAFCNAFEQCSLWVGERTNYMMVGLKNPSAPPQEERFARVWRSEQGRRLRALGFHGPEQIGSLFVMDGQALDDWIGDQPPLVDNYPRRISYKSLAQRHLLTDYFREIEGRDSWTQFRRSLVIRAIWPATLVEKTRPHFELRNQVDRLMGDAVLPADDLLLCLKHPLLRDYVVEACSSDAIAQEILARSGIDFAELSEADLETHLHFAAAAASRRDWDAAERVLARAVERLGGQLPPVAHYHLATFRMTFLTLDGRAQRARQVGREFVAAGGSGHDMQRFWNVLRQHVRP